MHTLNSGGARGADTYFGVKASRLGHTVKHWHHDPKKASYKDFVILSTRELEANDHFIKKANKQLERKFPCASVDATNLIRRNFYQVINSDDVYGVSELNEDHIRVEGGTGWAVEYFKLIHPNQAYAPNMYIFCQKIGSWFKWSTRDYKFYEMNEIPPMPSGAYAGIGSRKLTGLGILAINELYDERNT